MFACIPFPETKSKAKIYAIIIKKKKEIHPLQLLFLLLLLLFWISHYKSPRPSVQSSVRKINESCFSLITGGNPKQQSLRKHIYLLSSCVSLPHLTVGATWWPTCLLLLWCTVSKSAVSPGDRWGEGRDWLWGSLLFLYCFLGETQQKLNSVDLLYWFACARTNSTCMKKIRKEKKMFKSEPVSVCVCSWNMPKSEKWKRLLKIWFSKI